MIPKIVTLLLSLIALVLAADRAAAGQLFTTSNNTVISFDASGNPTTFAATGLNDPTGLAFDSAGNLYVASWGNGTIRKFSATGTDLGYFATTGLVRPFGLAFDAAGNLYAASQDNTIRRFSATGEDLGSFATTGLNQPTGLAFDAAGNLYAANYGTNAIREFSATGADLGFFATTGMSGPFGLAFDGVGNLYVANYYELPVVLSSTGIRKFSAAGTDLGDFATPTILHHPIGLAFDEAGNLYAGFTGEGVIRAYSAAGTDLGNFATSGSSFMVFRPDAVTAVPEPASLTVFSIGVASMVLCTRRRRSRLERQ